MESKTITTQFIEIPGSYPTRTAKNINEADGTLIFYVNANTPGEKLTLRVLTELKKPYLQIKLINGKFDKPSISLQKFIDKYKIKTLNIAGNSISRFKNLTQNELDQLIFDFLNHCSNIKTLDLIQSGGQSGVDTSGVKAGIKLGIKTKVNAPGKWLFRDKDGNDIADKELFIKRFV
jgi:hypothetical protein